MKRQNHKRSLIVFFLAMWFCGASDGFSATNSLNHSNFPPNNIPELLGWVPLPACQNICCGYYKDPLATFFTSPLPPITTTSVQLSASQSTFSQTGTSVLIGNVTITQPGRLITADQAYLNRDPKTGEIASTDLKGHVVLREPGKLVVGDSGYIELHTKVANLMHAIYHFVLGGPSPLTKAALTKPTPPLFTTKTSTSAEPPNAWGTATFVAQQQSGIIELKNATYTTCAPTSNTWRVSAKTINLNPNIGRGYAYNAWLDAKGIPIFYTPYFEFPIDNRRQSGFLFPSVGHTSRGGYSLTTPYYWNIAPNYDATITPTIYTKRGVSIDGLFRYLFPWTSGNISGGFLPDDPAFADFQEQAKKDYAGNPALGHLLNSRDTRDYFSWQDTARFNPHWTGSINYNYVSDDYYIEDFHAPNTSVSNQLPQQASLNYSGDIWTFMGRVQGYQTLHPVNQATVDNAYQSFPELDLNANLPNQAYGLNYKLNDQFIYFERSSNPGELTNPPNATRLNIEPSISLPINNLGGYFTPTLQFATTYYDIGNQVAGFQSSVQRYIPLFDVDSGLYFDRDVTLFGKEYQQTLEPRIFYLYVPYVNQNDIPLFDTALMPFSYDNLFLTNRFSGIDRIGDANQVTLALTTRFLDSDTGAEKFRGSLGQIYYFRDRLVSSCAAANTPGAASTDSACTNPLALVGATSSTEHISPFAGQMVYNFNKNWSAIADGAWDPTTKQAINGNFNFQYKPAEDRIVNIGYNFLRLGDPQTTIPPTPTESHKNDLNQISLSAAWPIWKRWQAVGGWNYDIAHHFPQTYLYGLEYDSCCWAIRFVAGRTYVGLNQNDNPTFNNAFYIQWQFKGLGNVGTGDPASLLVNDIPGYQDIFDNYAVFKELTI